MFFRSFRRTFLTPVRLLGGILFLQFRRWSDRCQRRAGPRRGGLLLPGLLLAGDGLLLALPGPGVGLGALAVHGEPATVADALVAPDLDLAPDVGLHLAAQVTFDLVAGLDPVPEPDQLVVGEVVHPGVTADLGGLQRLQRAGAADSVDIRKGDLQPLVAGEGDADEACHRGQYSFGLRRSCAPLPATALAFAWTGPGLLRGSPLTGCGRLRAAVRVLRMTLSA